MSEILYLSSSDVESLNIGPAAMANAVEHIFKQKTLGAALLKPKSSISPGPGSVVQTLIGADLHAHDAAVKWVSVSPDNRALELPAVQALVVLSDTRTGRAKAIMDGTWLTGVRTAACSAVAAKYLANRASRSVGLVGAGVQARTHIAALRVLLPNLRVVSVYAGASQTADEFVDHALTLGLDARKVVNPRDAVHGHDIVISTIPPSAGLQPFLDPGWVKPGSFVSAVDLGRSWRPAEWTRVFDVIATDDRAQSAEQIQEGKMLPCRRFDCEIGELSLRMHAGRLDDRQRTALLFAGTALADLAAASLVESRAREMGVGRMLPA